MERRTIDRQRHRERGQHPAVSVASSIPEKENERTGTGRVGWKLASWMKRTNYSMSLPHRIQSVVKSWKSTLASFHQADDDEKRTGGFRSNCVGDCLRDGARCDCLSRRNNAYWDSIITEPTLPRLDVYVTCVATVCQTVFGPRCNAESPCVSADTIDVEYGQESRAALHVNIPYTPFHIVRSHGKKRPPSVCTLFPPLSRRRLRPGNRRGKSEPRG